MQVTNFEWLDERYIKSRPPWKSLKTGERINRTGFYMDENLATNMMGVPNYLKKAWDVVGIVSGHGRVRIGKLLPLGSDILLSNGTWKKVEDVKVNDKVISPSIDGKESEIAKVIETVTHKNLEMCEIRSSRNNELLYTCCVDHNVPVRILRTKRNKNNPREYIWKDEIYPAGELAKKSKDWYKRCCPKIITSPTITKFDAEDFNVDPYFLGLYLGDGWTSSKNRVNISNPDEGIFDWLKINFNVIKKYKNNSIVINYKSEKLKDCGTGAYHKKIPKEVLSSSYEYRKKVLEGLLDTDSYINPSGYITYTTASEKLAKGVHNLCKTLGCRVSIKITYKNCQTFSEKRKYYNVHINLGTLSKNINIIRERKKRLLNVNLKDIKNNETPFEKIIVTKIPERMDGCCIQVDSKSHLYITDNYSVTHNSTLAQQIGFFLAWQLAGGTMARIGPDGNRWLVDKKPEKETKFNIKDNIVFSPEELMKKASDLYKRYGRNQVIVYDEGRAGLDSARAMQAINKVMQDFFQECGQYGHIIIIVLPSFFKLHEDYATSRSLFLVDVFADRNLRRGYFNFYTERQKEYLYLNGKKRLGTLAKYAGCHHSFGGRFTKFLPVPSDEYDKAKQKALKTKDLTRTDRKWKQQRDAALYLIRRETEMKYATLAREMTVLCGFPISDKMMSLAVSNITKTKDEKD